MSETEILAGAINAATTLSPRIMHALALAGAGSHDERLRGIRLAQDHTKELLTRLETAELELAAQATTERAA